MKSIKKYTIVADVAVFEDDLPSNKLMNKNELEIFINNKLNDKIDLNIIHVNQLSAITID